MTLVVESHIVYVRKNRLAGWKQGNIPEKRFWNPCLWRGFLFAMSSIKRGRTCTSPGWKRRSEMLVCQSRELTNCQQDDRN